MVRSSKFDDIDYLFHLHTNYTDGKLTVEDYFKFAKKNRYRKVIFLEHIKKHPTYDVEAMVWEIKNCAAKYGMNYRMGFEAKILPRGELDISEEHINLAEYIGIAEHGFFGNVDIFLESFCEVIRKYSKINKIVIWVHPGLWFMKNNLEKVNELYLDLLNYCLKFDVLIEHNLKYNMLPYEYIRKKIISSDKIIVGLDAHEYTDLSKFLRKHDF